MLSSLSIPFWSESSTVSGRKSGRAASAADSVSYVLTQKRIRSTGPTSSGSSVARTPTVNDPTSLHSTVRPRARNASNCVPRAMKATSSPARAKRPPKYPPVPPAPTTAMRIADLLLLHFHGASRENCYGQNSDRRSQTPRPKCVFSVPPCCKQGYPSTQASLRKPGPPDVRREERPLPQAAHGDEAESELL